MSGPIGGASRCRRRSKATHPRVWHQDLHADLPAHVKAAAALLSVWDIRNSDERKHVDIKTSRQRK